MAADLAEFGATLISMRASLFKPAGDPAPDSQQLREAIDAALVRAIHAGDYQRIESQYFASNGFESVAAFTCGINPDYFTFPDAASATGQLKDVLDAKELKVAALGPSNWGYQGNYEEEDPSGLWPDYMNAVFAQFVKQCVNGLATIIRQHRPPARNPSPAPLACARRPC